MGMLKSHAKIRMLCITFSLHLPQNHLLLLSYLQYVLPQLPMYVDKGATVSAHKGPIFSRKQGLQRHCLELD